MHISRMSKSSPLSIHFVFHNVTSFLYSSSGLTSIARLLRTSKQFLQTFAYYSGAPTLWHRNTTDTPQLQADKLESLTLLAWPSYLTSSTEDGPSSWQGTTHHKKYRTLVPQHPDNRVAHYNGQTLRAKGTTIISLGRKASLVHSTTDQTDQSTTALRAPPLVQAAVHSSTVQWGAAARSTAHYLFHDGCVTPLPPILFKTTDDASTLCPSYFGCDFLPEREPTLVLVSLYTLNLKNSTVVSVC